MLSAEMPLKVGFWMKKWSFTSVILGALFSTAGCEKPAPAPSSDNRTLLTIINASKKCEDTNTGIECNYRVGDFFKVSIADIGTAPRPWPVFQRYRPILYGEATSSSST